MPKVSVVINTFNEEENLPRALSSVVDFADEIIVCDMHSTDRTREIAKKFGAKIYLHDYVGYVEPARNDALSRVLGDWILVLDADEELTDGLKDKLKEIAQKGEVDYVLIPRKNIIFGKWIKHSRWWPDDIIRFFRKGKVTWSDQIHSLPKAEGRKIVLEPNEENVIIHYNYLSLDQYLERMVRYSRIQAEELSKAGYQFSWQDLIGKPLSEFLSRFFAGEGYKDGVHGLALALLQSFSEFLVYARVWEIEGFKDEDTQGVFGEIEKSLVEIKYWLVQKTKNPLKKLLRKLK